MQDILSNMLSERFLDEIFRPQETCSKKALRIIFERICHTSIMRLNESSMDKVNYYFSFNFLTKSFLFQLFDLMTMAVKYQVSLTMQPREILLVTLNHLDTIATFVPDSKECLHLIEQCYKRIFKVRPF